MMNKYLLSTIIILTVTLTHAQKMEGFVFSENSLEPIQYANIHVVNSNVGTYVNEQGEFSLNLEQTDTLHISCVGFVEVFQKASSLNSGDTIFLKPLSYNVPEIIVSNKTKTNKLGYLEGKTLLYHIFPAYDWGTEFSCFIQNQNNNPSKVVKVVFKAKEGKAESVIRLHINKPLENGMPGEELLQEDILLNSANISKGKLIVDVSEYNIICTSEGLFVGLELIGYKEYDYLKNDLKNKDNNIIEIGLTKSNNAKCYTKFIFDEYAQWERVYNSPATYRNFGSALAYQIELQVLKLE